MKDFIIDCIKDREDYLYLFSHKVVEGDISHLRLAYRRTDYKYAYMECFFNQSTIFIINKDLESPITTDSDINIKLSRVIEILDDKEDCIDRMQSKINTMLLDLYFKNLKQDCKSFVLGYKEDNLEIKSVDVYLNPTCSIIIKLKYNDRYESPLVVTIGTPLYTNKPYLYNLINYINSRFGGGLTIG